MIDPLLTSPWLGPVLSAMTAADAVLPMIPSEAVVLGAGVLGHSGGPNLLMVVLAAAAGIVLGDHVAYALARSVLGPRLIHRSKHLTRAVQKASGQLDKRGSLLIVTSRFVPGGRVTLNATCGTTRLPLSRFTPASAIAALAWASYTVGLGYLGGAAFLAHPVLGLLAGLALSFALGAVIELIRKRIARRREAAEAAEVIRAAELVQRETSVRLMASAGAGLAK